MIIELIILSFLFFLLVVSIYLKNFWLGVATILGLIILSIYYFFFKKTVVKFFFINDAENVEVHPEIYCGDDLLLPQDYDEFGSRYKCLRKGIGTGMVLSDVQRNAFLSRQRQSPQERVYCGDKDTLPLGFNRNGSPLECFKKGVGTGLGMPQEKRRAIQQRPTRIGKKELINLADKFKVDHSVLTRRQTLDLVSGRIRDAKI